MDYAQAVAYLFARLPMFQRIGGAAYKMDLGNIVALVEALGNPHQAYPTVHIAGTNGKGSVSSMTASVLMEAGYKVGLFTSPHLRSFTERIRVNGKEAPEAFVVDFVERHHAMLETVEPSFFEATAAMAFEYFRQEKVDIAVIEVGMGGRLDSTNIILPEAAAITNISMDHGQFLGDTIAKIAGEKAGIMKAGIDVVIGQVMDETRPVFEETAELKGSKLIFAEESYAARRIRGDFFSQEFELKNLADQSKVNLKLDLSGHYQQWNLQTAATLVECLRRKGWKVNADAFAKGIAAASKNSGLKGRMSVIAENPLTIADIAHNEDGVKQVLGQIAAAEFPQVHFVWGMVADKDVRKVLSMLPKSAKYYFVQPDLPRAMKVEELTAIANELGLEGIAHASVQAGLDAAKLEASKNDLIYVGGSTFVVAEVI